MKPEAGRGYAGPPQSNKSKLDSGSSLEMVARTRARNCTMSWRTALRRITPANRSQVFSATGAKTGGWGAESPPASDWLQVPYSPSDKEYRETLHYFFSELSAATASSVVTEAEAM